jgi:GNAT acetyltransferase-like protein
VVEEVEIVALDDRDRWEAEHRIDGLPSQSWTYASALSASGSEPKLAIVRAAAARMLLPFFERDWLGTTDVATIRGLSGTSITPAASAPLGLWREYATSQGWVAGYIQLATAVDAPELPPDDQPVVVNAVFVLDLGSRELLKGASEIVRRKIRKAVSVGVELVEDRSELADRMRSLYPSTMQRVGARSGYDVAGESLDRWVLDPSSVVLGARVNGLVEAVSVFCVAGKHAEYHINASSPRGRELAAWLIWIAIERLRAAEVQTLNLGGGVRPGDGVYRFKERFHGVLKPLLAVCQVYDHVVYDELCRRTSARTEAGPAWFPAYRAPT